MASENHGASPHGNGAPQAEPGQKEAEAPDTVGPAPSEPNRETGPGASQAQESGGESDGSLDSGGECASSPLEIDPERADRVAHVALAGPDDLRGVEGVEKRLAAESLEDVRGAVLYALPPVWRRRATVLVADLDAERCRVLLALLCLQFKLGYDDCLVRLKLAAAQHEAARKGG